MQPSSRHAEISGGGIAGLATAIALAQNGWSVCVHERSAALRAEGAGIYIWENGLRVLSALGIYEDAVRGCHWGFMRETRNEYNQLVSSARLGVTTGVRVASIARERLLGALYNRAMQLGVQVRFNSAVRSANAEGSITLGNDEVRKADLIVGADGVNSKVRDSLGLLRLRKPLKDGALRFMIDRLPSERESREDGKYIEYWSGVRRILYTPVSSEQIYLAFTTLDSDVEAKQMPLSKEVWKRSFPHLTPLIDRVGEEAHWARFELIKLKRWSQGRVAVLGDAASALAPNLGQGGGCALMNALALAVAIEETSSIEAGLNLWERRERPLTEHTQRVSSLYSEVTTLPSWLRSLVFAWAGRSRWAIDQRMRTARHIPTGGRA